MCQKPYVSRNLSCPPHCQVSGCLLRKVRAKGTEPHHGECRHRSHYLSHAKQALYHLSLFPWPQGRVSTPLKHTVEVRWPSRLQVLQQDSQTEAKKRCTLAVRTSMYRCSAETSKWEALTPRRGWTLDMDRASAEILKYMSLNPGDI